jgi:5-methylthioadenosine/S-adenosylhomocysteine deaminase
MTDHLITNGIIYTVDPQNTILAEGAILVSNGRIAALGSTKDLLDRHPEVERIDASGMVVMPGLVNSHTHLSMTMTRSIADDIEATSWLPVIWAVEKHLKPETVYAGALLGIAEMIASGTTTFNDHYFMMDQVAKAVQETGMRADLAEGILENRDKKKGQRELEAGKKFAADWKEKANGRIRTRMGPHALYTCSTELVLQACRAAKELGVGVHMHVAESSMEMKMVGKKAQGPTSVQHLDALGVLGPDFAMAHGLTINEADIRILTARHVGIAHCPQAYAKVGGYPFPPVDKWLEMGLNVGLGTDGVASNNNLDLFDEMRFATMVRKLFKHDGAVLPARQVIRMATIGSARVLGLDDEIGSLEVGKKADIIFVDFRKPHLTPLHNVPGHLMYSASGADVDTVMVDGEILMQNHEFKTLDWNGLRMFAQREFEALLGRANWHCTMEEPKAGIMASLQLKAIQQSLKVMQVLVGAREPDQDEIL